MGKIAFESTLLVNRNGFYALLDGTGVVFKASNRTKDSITFTRIDSTMYFGNTYYSAKFFLNDTLYSFGGYGFYRNNGHLLFFTQGKDWNIIPLNIELPASNALFHLNYERSLLYYTQIPYGEESVNRSVSDFTFYRLDVKNRIITKLGLLNEKLHLISSIRFKMNSPNLNGLLVSVGNNILLLRPSENKIYRLLNGPSYLKLQQVALNNCGYIFEHNGSIYYNYHDNEKLDTLNLSITDFEETREPVYHSNNDNVLNIIMIGLGSVLLLSFLAFQLKRNLKKAFPIELKNSTKAPITETVKLTSNADNIFSFLERELIDKIFNNDLSNQITTVSEINNYLGLKKKSPEVQKKVRTETINNININFKILTKSNQELIIRIRSEDDKRFYNYSIDKEAYSHYLKLFPKE